MHSNRHGYYLHAVQGLGMKTGQHVVGGGAFACTAGTERQEAIEARLAQAVTTTGVQLL